MHFKYFLLAIPFFFYNGYAEISQKLASQPNLGQYNAQLSGEDASLSGNQLMIDKTKMFKDFNFKLAVINELLDKNPSFEKELETLKAQYLNDYIWYLDDPRPIPELLAFFSKLQLTSEDLDKITELCLDAGNEIYSILQPDWDGEDEQFDFNDISGIENLKNLKTIEYISMCDRNILTPLETKGIIIMSSE